MVFFSKFFCSTVFVFAVNTLNSHYWILIPTPAGKHVEKFQQLEMKVFRLPISLWNVANRARSFTRPCDCVTVCTLTARPKTMQQPELLLENGRRLQYGHTTLPISVKNLVNTVNIVKYYTALYQLSVFIIFNVNC